MILIDLIDQDPHWYTCKVKEAVHIRLHPNNIKFMKHRYTIKKRNNRKMVQQQTAEKTIILTRTVEQ